MRAQASQVSLVRIAALQAAAVGGDPEASRRRYDDLLEGLACDLVLLPELALAGYDPRFDYTSLAEPADGPTAAWARRWAERLGATVVVGLPLAEPAGVANAVLAVPPGGAPTVYRKRHLWGGEAEQFSPGSAPPPLLEAGSLRWAPAICYDMTFADTTATLAGQVDLLAVAAAWPWLSAAHAAAARDLARGLATQLGAAVAFANQVGRCRVGTRAESRPDRGAGLSLVTLPYRAAEARAPARGAAAAVLEIDLEVLRKKQHAKFG